MENDIMENDQLVDVVPSIRPRFKLPNATPSELLIQQITQALMEQDAPIKGTVAGHHITLRIPVDKQHYWSPQLDLEIEEQAEGSLIRGLFGPSPSVWFMYVFFYSILGFASLIVTIMGFSQLNLGLSARILWILPVTLVLFIFAYSTARAGQKLGEEEMRELYNFLLESTKSIESK